MKKLLSSACFCLLALLAGAAVVPDPPHMPKRLPKVCRIGGRAAEIRGNTAAVVVAPGAPQTVRFAARELTAILNKVLGGSIKVETAPQPGKYNIFLGFSKWTAEAGIVPAGHHRDSFTMKITPKGAFIAGIDDPKADPEKNLSTGIWGQLYERGTLFGVYDFLERFAGVRFYFPGELGTVVPRKSSIVLPETHIFDYPDFTVRRASFYEGKWPGKPASDRAWSEKNLAQLRTRMETQYVPCCHGLSRLGYLQRFGKSHPEYFALMTNGRRHNSPSLPHPGSLCYSSGIQEEIFQDVKSFLLGEPPTKRGVLYRNGKPAWDPSGFQKGFADIMPQDSYYRCGCKLCEPKYGKGDNYATEFMWGVTVKTARRLQQEKVPGFVTMMAYRPYRDVPRIDLPSNLLVMVAERGPWGQYNPAGQAKDLAEIAAWTKKLNFRVWLWNYFCKMGGTAFPGIPSPTPRCVAPYLKQVTPYITGAYFESETDRWINNYLLYYVYGKLAWNNKADSDALIAEHHKLMFGKAAGEMGKLFDLFEKIWLKEIVGRQVDTDLGPAVVPPSDYDLWHKIYDVKRIGEVKAAFDRAEKLVRNDKDSLARVKLFRGEWLEPLLAARAEYIERTDAAGKFSCSPDSPAYLRVFGREGENISHPPVETRVSVSQDEKNFTFTFDCEEPLFDEMAASVRPRDATDLWQHSGVELFIDPTGERKVYYQWILNARNCLFDQKLTMHGARSTGDRSWNSGAVTSITRTPRGYRAVITFPKSVFPVWNKAGFPVNFGRTRILSKSTGHATLYTWSPFIKGFHDLENYGLCRFEPQKTLPDIIQNGNFSAQPKGRFFGGWYAGTKLEPGQSWQLDKGVFFTAPPSLKLVNAKGGKAKEMSVTQYLPKLKPATRYRLSAYVRLDDVKPITRGGGVVLNLFDAGNRWYPTHALTGSTPNWVRQSFEFKTPAKLFKSPYLRLRLFKATGTVWFDDVKLEELSE